MDMNIRKQKEDERPIIPDASGRQPRRARRELLSPEQEKALNEIWEHLLERKRESARQEYEAEQKEIRAEIEKYGTVCFLRYR